MRKILDFVRKFNTPLTYGVLSVLFGIAFILLPSVAPLALDVLLVLAGVAVIFIGVLTVTELDTPDRGLRYYLNAIKTVALIAFGIFIITMRGALATRFCFVFGVCILLRAVPSLIRVVAISLASEAMWWVQLVLSAVEISLGVWLIFFPRWPHVITGVMLLIVGIDLLAKRYTGGRKTADRPDTLYDLDFEDKS